MPVIELTTVVNAPIDRCFDLSRSIDLHKLSMHGTAEEAIAGVTTGLIGIDQQVTWRATHFGITQTLTSKITQYDRPNHFRDEMVKGVFKMLQHDHYFEKASKSKTVIRDVFRFESPGGVLGLALNNLVLKDYLRDLLIRRNETIRRVAESEEWKSVLKQ